MIRKSRINQIGVLVLTMGIVLISCTGCQSERKNVNVPKLVEPVGVDIDTATVKKMDFGSMNSYQGEIVPDIKGMYFVNAGQVASVKVEIGDKVKKGQLLATLKGADTTVKDLQKELRDLLEENTELNETAKNKIQQLKEELNNTKKKLAKAVLKKDRNAYNKQIIAQKENIKTEELKLKQQKELQGTMVANLKEDLQQARSKTKLDKLYSSVNGEVLSKTISPGDFISGGGVVINIADMEKTKIRTEYIGNSVLNKASSYHAMINGHKYEVSVEEQDVSQFDVEMGNYPKNTYFNYKKDVNVSVGDSVSVDLYNNTEKDALVVPSNAVYRTKSDSYVYLMKGNAKKKVSVTVGTATDAYTQILTGVKEGDVVYVQD